MPAKKKETSKQVSERRIAEITKKYTALKADAMISSQPGAERDALIEQLRSREEAEIEQFKNLIKILESLKSDAADYAALLHTDERTALSLLIWCEVLHLHDHLENGHSH